MFSFLLRSIVFVFCLFGSGVVLAAEPERDAIRLPIHDAIVKDFQESRFSAIESRYLDLVQKPSMLPEGLPTYRVVLDALSNMGWPTEADSQSPQKEHKEAYLRELDGIALHWQNVYPESSLAAFARTALLINRAFLYRGNGYLNAVTPAGLDAWRKLIKEAERGFYSPKSKVKKDAVWYAAALKLAQFQQMSMEDFRVLLEEGSRKYPQFYPIYLNAAGRVEPRWGGRSEDMEWLANLAAERSKSTEGDGFYARIYWTMANRGIENIFNQTNVDWQRMKKGFEDMLLSAPYYVILNRYGRFACQARDKNTLINILERIDATQLDVSVWGGAPYFNYCRAISREKL